MRENVGNEPRPEEEMGLFGKQGWIDDPDHDGEDEPKLVPVRIAIRRMHDGRWCRLVLMDEYNTSICESTFANLNVYGPLLKVMNPSRSQFYIREVVASKNAIVTEHLLRQQMNPRDPIVGEEGRRAVPLRSVFVGMSTL